MSLSKAANGVEPYDESVYYADPVNDHHGDKDLVGGAEDGDVGVTQVEEEHLRRGLSQRHVSMIALAGELEGWLA